MKSGTDTKLMKPDKGYKLCAINCLICMEDKKGRRKYGENNQNRD